jgi:hypothetical protein
MQAGVDHLVEVVRRILVAMPTAIPDEPLISRFGIRAGKPGLFLRTVVVRPEIDSFLVDIGQHFMGDLRQADFGVTHRRGVVAVHRTEVALAIDQHVAQEKSCAIRTMVSYTAVSPCG